MKNLNTLKLIIAIGLAGCFKTQAQDVSDQFWNSGTINAKDIGQAIAENPLTTSTYVAGEQNTGLNSQAIRIVRYNSGGTISIKYDSSYYKETVKQLIFRNNKLYLIGNAVDTSGIATMFLLRLNTNLGIEKVKWFKTAKYNNPVKAVFDNTDIYIACSKNVSGIDRFSIVKVDTNFTTIAWTVPSYTTYRRIPTDLIFNGTNLYVAGSAKSGTLTLNTSGFAMKFNSSLGLLWEHNGSLSGFQANGYNSIAVNSNDVFVGGSEYANNDQRWVMKKLNKSTGVVSATHRTGGSNFSNDIGSVVKITSATNDTVHVAGYVKNQALNTFIIKSAKYNSSLGAYSVANSTLSYDSKLNDAVYYESIYDHRSILTGSTKIGSNYCIYFTEFNDFSHLVVGGQTETNRNAAGNKIILSNGIGGSYAKLIGFSDANTGNQPENLQFVTKFISTQIDRLASSSSSNLQSSFTMFPNPANDEVTIESTEVISSFVIYDMMGKTILEQQSGEETFQERINISALPKGIYLLKVNNNATQKLIKN